MAQTLLPSRPAQELSLDPCFPPSPAALDTTKTNPKQKRAHSFILQSPEMSEQRQAQNEDLALPGNKSDVDWQVKSCPACLESQMSPPAARLGPFLLSKRIFQSVPLSLQDQSHFPILHLDRNTELPLAPWACVWDFWADQKGPRVTRTIGSR